ncbi:MAG: mannose-6-phosphate isomerase, class I [Spirochaetia bacterium]|nr:mannose-6-phosphate isomerase, class I [Spirochaetia bacterium]
MDRFEYNRFYHLIPAQKHYAWGSETKIQALTGLKADGKPLAEIWMGSHPNGMSYIEIEGKAIPVSDFIAGNPEKALGKRCIEKFGSMPFLFKMLAADKPLSIQAHPDSETAISGFEREERNHIPMDHFTRVYKDSNHKREMIYAISTFYALKGFRSVEEIKVNFKKFFPFSGNAFVDFRYSGEEDFYKKFFTRLLSMDQTLRKAMLRELEATASGMGEVEQFIFRKLLYDFPGDRCVFAPLFLNCIKLNPGECMSIDEGQLHSYVDGLCFEVMSSSDNTIRGGLTEKFIDVLELFTIMKFVHGSKVCVDPVWNGLEKIYSPGWDEFCFSSIVIGGKSYTGPKEHSLEIIFIYSGSGKIENSAFSLDIKSGTAVLIPAEAGEYTIFGSPDLVLYKAAMPL